MPSRTGRKLQRPDKPSAAGILSIEEAAGELGTSPLAVQRLIARGQIRSTTLGDGKNGVATVMASELARYVSSGAQDFVLPPIGVGGWFSDAAAERFKESARSTLAAACDDQRLDAAAATSYAIQNDPFKGRKNCELNVRLHVTDAVKSAWAQKVGGSKPTLSADAVRGRYKSLGWLYAVCCLRKAAGDIRPDELRPPSGIKTIGDALTFASKGQEGLFRFYENETAYAEYCEAAMARLRGLPVVVFRDSVRMGEDALAPRATIIYRLNWSAIVMDDGELCDAAF